MASNLYGLARQVSEYLRNRFQRQYREADQVVEERSGGLSSYAQKRRGLFGHLPPGGMISQPGAPPIDPDEVRRRSMPGAPPVQGPRKTPQGFVDRRPSGAAPIAPPGGHTSTPGAPPVQQPPVRPPLNGEEDEKYDDIQLLGRDAGYDEDDFVAVMSGLRHTPGSTNVYGYYFERESRKQGILYVTFLDSWRSETRSGPGPTYAYYDVPVKKALEFQKATAESAGGAVWDYLRIRGSSYAHQHMYRLMHVHGEYVPRKVTKYGYQNRAVPALGVGRRSFKRNTLPAQQFYSRGAPDRGGPDRGEPDRG